MTPLDELTPDQLADLDGPAGLEVADTLRRLVDAVGPQHSPAARGIRERWAEMADILDPAP